MNNSCPILLKSKKGEYSKIIGIEMLEIKEEEKKKEKNLIFRSDLAFFKIT